MSNDNYTKLRKKIGTQESASKLLGVDIRTIQRRERGECRISREAEFAIKFLLQNLLWETEEDKKIKNN